MVNNKNFIDREILMNKNLKELRRMKSLTQDETFEVLNIPKHSYISYERKQCSMPPPIYISRICQYFNVTFDELFFSRDIRRDKHNRENNIESSNIVQVRKENIILEEKIADMAEKEVLLKKLLDAYEKK